MEMPVEININMSDSPRCSTVTVYLGCQDQTSLGTEVNAPGYGS